MNLNTESSYAGGLWSLALNYSRYSKELTAWLAYELIIQRDRAKITTINHILWADLGPWRSRSPETCFSAFFLSFLTTDNCEIATRDLVAAKIHFQLSRTRIHDIGMVLIQENIFWLEFHGGAKFSISDWISYELSKDSKEDLWKLKNAIAS